VSISPILSVAFYSVECSLMHESIVYLFFLLLLAHAFGFFSSNSLLNPKS
jgi:hypothetical protein